MHIFLLHTISPTYLWNPYNSVLKEQVHYFFCDFRVFEDISFHEIFLECKSCGILALDIKIRVSSVATALQKKTKNQALGQLFNVYWAFPSCPFNFCSKSRSISYLLFTIRFFRYSKSQAKYHYNGNRICEKSSM